MEHYHINFSSSNLGGVGLFYFAGHGIEVGGVNYLIPSDIRVSNQKYIPYKSTPLNPIIEMMNETGKRLNIAILDACRENPFTSTRNNKRGGLASFSASGTFVAYSAESGKLAEDGSGNLSPFAESFIKELDRPQTIERLFKNVRTDVHTKTGGKQTPETKNLIMGDFYFKLPEEIVGSSPTMTKRNQTMTGTNVTSSEVKRSKHRIYVSTTPENARVRILNIKPKYVDGIDLKTNKALVEVTKSGYKKYLKWHRNLKDEAVISVELEEIVGSSPTMTKTAVTSSRVERSQNVWIDNSTKLMWQNQPFTAEDKKHYDNNTNGGRTLDWNLAVKYCKDLELDGYLDWRLPEKDELKTLLTPSKNGWLYIKEPFVKNTEVLKGGKYNYFSTWTNTKYNGSSSLSWVVYFHDGDGYWYYRHSSSSYVVCVRDL
jgi:hypothetical protein